MGTDAELIHESGVYLVITTVGSMTAARELSRPLVEQRLAACANITDRIESIYWWNGALQSEGEVMVLFKVPDTRLQQFKSELLRRHPYKVPELVALRLDAVAQPYLSWITAETAGGQHS